MDGETPGPSPEELQPEDLKIDKVVESEKDPRISTEPQDGQQNKEKESEPDISKEESSDFSKQNEALESVGLKPLSEPEEAVLKMGLIKISQYSNPYDNKSNIVRGMKMWNIVDEYGERAVPAILDYFGGKHSSELRSFLDTLVTEKTAPLVLEAIQEGKITAYDGAIAAAVGGEQTANGLAKLLVDLKIPGEYGRSEQVALLEALSYAKDESTIPAITTYWQNLREDSAYRVYVQNHLSKQGNNLYTSDGYDVVRSIATIDGPRGHDALVKLFESGDTYIDKTAQQALEGELYLGHPSKFTIKEPETGPIEYEQDQFDDLTDDTFTHGPTEKTTPEPLVSMEGINLIDPAVVNNPEVRDELRFTLNRFFSENIKPRDAVNELHKMGGLPEQANKLQAARAEIFLQTLKDLDQLPNLEALRTAFHEHTGEEKLKGLGYDSETIHELSTMVRPFERSLSQSRQDDLRLPGSANKFTLVSEKLGKTRDIPPFVDQLRSRLHHRYVDLSMEVLSGQANARGVLQESFSDWRQLAEQYRRVSQHDVPIYDEAGKRLDQISKDRPEFFYGRDADYFYYAIKAQRLGMVDGKKPNLIYIDRPLASTLRAEWQQDQEAKDRIMAYLLQEKVTADGIHIDTGYRGSVPEAVIRALNPDMPEVEINERIKLLETQVNNRRLRTGGGVGEIENRAKKYGTIKDIDRDEKTGRLKVVFNKPSENEELKAWVIQQAVTRHNLPKAA